MKNWAKLHVLYLEQLPLMSLLRGRKKESKQKRSGERIQCIMSSTPHETVARASTCFLISSTSIQTLSTTVTCVLGNDPSAYFLFWSAVWEEGGMEQSLKVR
jgi:hypothetical protein